MHNNRVDLPSIVSRQLPEFIREDYPTFVAFVEAYYEYLHTQEVDLTHIRDIDETLDDFIQYFKLELATNLPNIVGDERLLLKNIKDQYLSKGSEGSFKLLFRMLFGKNVQLMYPGQQMLVASDGRWNQEISVFVKVEYGDPLDTVGRLVDIQSGDRILRVLVDRKEDLIGEVDRIVALGGNIYEMYLDKRFFGVLQPGDRVKYRDIFQAQILPATTTINVTQPGRNFRVGQVFELISGGGTGALVKVTQVTPTGGLKNAEVIKFGIGYTSNFAVSVLARNTVNARKINLTSSSSRLGDDLYIGTSTLGTNEQGYINRADYVSYTYVDAAYAGTVLREFTLDYRNAQTDSTEPAIIEVRLGALNRYPGYFETNNGFLSDSIFIQDSEYYQKFSYVLRIDERLSVYKSAVKTMVHPSGLRLFGEYDITNQFNLDLALECLVKSLGIGLEDDIADFQDYRTFLVSKVFSDTQLHDDTFIFKSSSKALADSEVGTLNDTLTQLVSKPLSDTTVGTWTDFKVRTTGKALSSTVGTLTETITKRDFSKSLSDIPVSSESYAATVAKYVEDNSIGSFSEYGEVWTNSYQGQDYYEPGQVYSEGLTQTF
jgi:hypothetical protein